MILETVAQSVDRQMSDLKFRTFKSWDYNLQNIFSQIECECFPFDLIYSKTEMLERGKKEGFEGMIIFRQKAAIATVLIYNGTDPEALYLDTFAVTKKGERLGTIIMDSLIKAASEADLREIALDTEIINSKGQKLVDYYRKFGFIEEPSKSIKDSIHMALPLKKN